jgi:ribosomal protein L7Ae-like RNA K-turn-binding protein
VAKRFVVLSGDATPEEIVAFVADQVACMTRSAASR